MGIRRHKRSLGYSVTTIKGQDIAHVHANNMVAALQGKAAGLRIAQTAGGIFGGVNINIRGASSLSGTNRPIFVIDGVIIQDPPTGASEWSGSPANFGNQLIGLNPNNIKSISVLKGSAATALYGSRALNGAVVIETKNGRKNSGLGIHISQTVGFRHAYKGIDFQDEFGPGTVAGFVSYGKKDKDGNFYRFDTGQLTYRKVNGKKVPTLIGAAGMGWGPKFSSLGKIFGYDHTMVPYRAYPNNFLNAFQAGRTSKTNLTLSGGTDRATFYFNGSIELQKGVTPKNKLHKYGGLLKVHFDINDFLSAEGSLNYVHSVPMNPPMNIGEAFTGTGALFKRVYPTNKFKDPDVYIAPHGGIPQNQFNDKYADVPGNGLWFSLYKHNSKRVQNTWRPTLKLTADIKDWLSLSLSGNLNVFNYRAITRNLGSGYRNKGGYFGLSNHHEMQESAKFTAHLKRDLKDFGLNATFGAKLFHTKYTNIGAHTNGGLIVPGKFFLTNSKDLRSNHAYFGGEKQINSVYALLNLSWKNQLYLNLSGRNDWSSALVYANGTGTYSYFYPSVGVSWIFNDTFNLPEWLSYGKLRASVGWVGSDTSPYVINQGYGIGSINRTNGIVYTNSINRTLISPNLKPEKKRSFSFGANLKFFNNRLGLDLTWYKSNTFNQILNVPAPYVSGATARKINAGNIQNKGIEISLTATPVSSKSFIWNFRFNYTRNSNKIIALAPGVGDYKILAGNPSYGNYRIGSVAFIGGRYGMLMSDSKPAKSKDGKTILLYDGTSRTAYPKRSGHVQKIGSTQPDFLGGVTNTFHYKNWSLSFLIYGRFGGYKASYALRYGTAWGFLKTSLPYRDKSHNGVKWTSHYADTDGVVSHDGVIPEGVFAEGTSVKTPDGTKQDISGMTFKQALNKGYIEPSHASAWHYRNNSWGTGTVNDNWVYELSYVALRNLRLSYALPVSVSQKLGIKGLQLSVQARNVLYFYNSSPDNLNPATYRNNGLSYSYFERNVMPYVRSISFTVNFSL